MFDRERGPQAATQVRTAPRPKTAGGAEALLRLQRHAGNRAVAAAVVQRCGPLKPDCGCPAEEKQAAEDKQAAEEKHAAEETAPIQRVVVQRDQLKPPPTGVSFQGHFFPNDAVQLRSVLEMLVAEKGAEEGESAAYAFLRMGPEERLRLQLKGVEPTLIDQVQAAFEPVLKTFQEERKRYVDTFRDEAAAGAQLILTKSMQALLKEQELYLGESFPAKEPDLDGLRAASKVLSARRRTADAAAVKAKDAFTKMRTQNQAPAHPGAVAPAPIVPFFPDPALREAAGQTNEAWFQEEQEYAKLRTQHERGFPSLAMFADNEDGQAADRLEGLQTWGLLPDRRLKAKILRELETRISNNDKASRTMEDKEKVWDLPKIIDSTLQAKKAKPHEQRWVKTRADQVHKESEELKRLLTAITIGLAVAAGILTLGAAAAVGTAGAVALATAGSLAQAGTTALTIATAYMELMEYRFKKATQETSLDRANSIATDDPSFLWLAITLVGVISEVGAAKSAFTTLKGTIQAAKTARNTATLTEQLGKMTEVPAATGETIANRVRAEIDTLAPQVADPATLKATAKLGSPELAKQPDLLMHEFQLAQSSPARRAIQNDVYAEEVILENGHVWRRQKDNGRWCRFSSDPLCFVFGEGGGSHIETFPTTRGPRQGEWSGTPRNSDFTPNDPIALVRANYRPIPYVNGFPDFSQFADARVLVPKNMYRVRDRVLHNQFADRELALQRGWRMLNGGADIQRATAYREVMEFTWHHVERDNVMLLVPTPIHNAAQHAGGIALPP